VAAPVDQPAQFARGLSDLVRDSGLFYESHVARWAENRYPLAQLLREPQALQDARAALPGPGPAAQATLPAGLPPAASPQAESGQPIVREQLGLLENRSATFTFQPWPGQEARLAIADERERQAAAGVPAADACWTSTLSLDLPRLGRIDAVLTLRGRQLQIAFAADDATQERMSADSPELRAAMADAGITLTAFGVRQDRHA
jgi:flagellar hook-length control protein FliK